MERKPYSLNLGEFLYNRITSSRHNLPPLVAKFIEYNAIGYGTKYAAHLDTKVFHYMSDLLKYYSMYELIKDDIYYILSLALKMADDRFSGTRRVPAYALITVVYSIISKPYSTSPNIPELEFYAEEGFKVIENAVDYFVINIDRRHMQKFYGTTDRDFVKSILLEFFKLGKDIYLKPSKLKEMVYKAPNI